MRIMNMPVDDRDYHALLSDTKALALLAILGTEHGQDAEFTVAEELGWIMGWTRRFVPAGRATLLRLVVIERVRHEPEQPCHLSLAQAKGMSTVAATATWRGRLPPLLPAAGLVPCVGPCSAAATFVGR
jgi:hypothetical protein